MKLSLRIVAVCGLSLAAVNRACSQTWTPANPPVVGCARIVSSADGSKLFGVSSSSSTYYLSTNAGASWDQPPGPFSNVTAIACSADGNRLVVAASELIYVSTNEGDSWEQHTNQQPVTSLACTSDGMTVFAACNSPVFMSTDGGASWTPFTNAPPAYFITCSADATTIAVGGGEPVFVSTNSGATWFASTEFGPGVPNPVCSADGLHLVARDANFRILTSANSGVTWVTNPLPQTSYSSLAISADGTTVAAAHAFNGYLYVSSNGGLNWQSDFVSTNGSFANPSFACVTASADGARLTAVDGMNPDGSNMYFWQSTPRPRLGMEISGSEIKLSWIVPSTPFVLQHNSDLATTNWVTLTNNPTLNLSTLRNEVTLPLNGENTFYRLATP